MSAGRPPGPDPEREDLRAIITAIGILLACAFAGIIVLAIAIAVDWS